MDWIRRFVVHSNKRHARGIGAAKVEGLLAHLTVVGRVSASTQNQAKSALLFLDRIKSAKNVKRLQIVVMREEINAH